MMTMMTYRRPDEETVVMTIKNVMDRYPRVDTQRELTALIRETLHEQDPDYRIGGDRIRRIGIDHNILRLSIDYHEIDNADLPEICPVCGNTMSPVMNMTLDGNITEIKRRCTVCPYGFGKTLLMPGRYSFTRVSDEETSENEKRIRKLELAKVKLHEASKLIDDALRMSGMEERGRFAKKNIEEIVESTEQSGSISNMIRDMHTELDAPGWTRPTVSVKNIGRKDI
jgi:hypothetical protein